MEKSGHEQLEERARIPDEASQSVFKVLSFRTAILDSMSEAVICWNTNLKLSWANRTARKLLGLSPSQLMEWRCHELWFQRDFPCLDCPIRFSFNPRSHESESSLPDGTMWSVRCTPFCDSDDQVLGVVCVASDISEKKLSEQALKASEARFRALFEQTGIGVAIFEKSGCITDSNPTLTEMLGYSREELCGRLFTDFIHPEDTAFDLEDFGKLTGGKYNTYKLEERYIRKNGDIRWGLFTISSIQACGDESQYAMATIEDITERKLAEEELARLATIVEQSEENVILVDNEGFVRYVNGSFERTSGYMREEILNRHISILRKDENHAEFDEIVLNTISRGEVWSGHITNRKKDGAPYEIEATISPLRDKYGIITCYAVLLRDVTNEMRLERQLRQAQKMEAIGTLAGGIAHDFNNILSAIMGYTQLALVATPQQTQASRYLEHILTAANRATDLVKHILTFSRQTEHEQKPVRIDSILKEALKLLRPSLPSTIEIRQSISSSIDPILADPSQIHQVMMNLCTNAAHSMREKGGILSVELAAVYLDPESVERYRDIKPGHYIKLTISDTGYGMETEIMERMFDPFFTTKGLEGGTGMGLSVVHGIVKNHGGAISVYSEPERGTTFNVLFPRIECTEDNENKTFKPLPTGNERILFVDDEEMLVTIAKQLLTRLGYAVVATTSSLEALHIFRDQPERFDLLITDQTMPYMTGTQLAEELLNIRPELPIILCTGFSEMVTAEKAKEFGIKEYIMKPVAQMDMAKSIRRVLD